MTGTVLPPCNDSVIELLQTKITIYSRGINDNDAINNEFDIMLILNLR